MLLLLLFLFCCCLLGSGAAQPSRAPPNGTPVPAAAPAIIATAPASAAATADDTSARAATALLALRAGWEDPKARLVSWSAFNAANVCSWRGVTCTNSSITSLDLARLSLSGTLSPAIANLSSLSTLKLSHNNFSGLIPPELGSLHSLTSLYLAHNSFYGSIPPALFQSSSLHRLLLDTNNLSGEVPAAIANLGGLKYLSLQSNALSGTILPSITNLTKLVALYAGSNSFNGTIPPQIGNLTRLVRLDLGANNFTGSIPSSIGSLTLLKQLDLQYNQLEGLLPTQLGDLSNVEEMNLSHNSFNGSIPLEIGNMSSLQTLDLCENNFYGTIPPSLGNLSMLQALNLSYNNLSGEIPKNGVLAKFNYSSYIGNKLLCGGPLIDSACDKQPLPFQHGRPHDRGTSQLGKNEKVAIAVVVGAFGLVVTFVFLVFCSCKTRQEEVIERSMQRARNSFSVDVAESMRKARLEIYMEGFPHNYEEIVSNAGYFDTAHVLGKGRFATVYRSDLPSGRQLAVKVFNNPITQSTFEREVANLHESACHISTLLDIRGYYSNPIEKAIFYDFMPKGTLYDVLHNSPTLLDWPKRINIALGVAQALSHLHRGLPSKLTHKDLKSSNVLLDDDLNPHVADYGLMDLVSKTVVETPGYTPPEFTILSYSVRRYTEKTDVYSFGVLLLELLTGKSPVSHTEDTSSISHDDEKKGPAPNDQKNKSPISLEEENSSTAHQQQESHVSDDEKVSHNEEEGHVSSQEQELETKPHLVPWVLGLHNEGKGLQVLDPFVVRSCPSFDHQVQALNLAMLCIDDEPAQRPSMQEAICILERLAGDASPMRDPEHQSKRPLLN